MKLKTILSQILLLFLAFFITYNTYHIQENTCENGKPVFEGAVCGDSEYGKTGGFPFKFIRDVGGSSVVDSIHPVEDQMLWKWFFVDTAIFLLVLQSLFLAVKKYKNQKVKDILFELSVTMLFSIVFFTVGWIAGATFGGNHGFFEYHSLPGYEAGGVFGSLIGLLMGNFVGLYLSRHANKKSFPWKFMTKFFLAIFSLDFILGYFLQVPLRSGYDLLLVFIPILLSVYTVNNKKYESK